VRPESEFALRAAYIPGTGAVARWLGYVPRNPAGKCGQHAILFAKSRMDISSPLPIFTGSAPSYDSAAATMASAASATYRNSRVGGAIAHKVIGTVSAPAGLHTFADQCGDHVRGIRIENYRAGRTDSRAQVDCVHAVLPPVCLALYQEGLLGDAVGALVSSGLASQRVSSRNGRGVTFG